MKNNESVFNLQRNFRDYLRKKGYSLAESNIITNNAFFLYDKKLGISFETFLERGVTEELKQVITEYFKLSGNIEYAISKANMYIDAMTLLHNYYSNESEEKIISTDVVNNEECFLINYCKTMRVHYSYKPLLILAMISTASVKGETTLSQIAYFFVNYYAKRIKDGLIAEKEDSVFSTRNVKFSEAKQIILNNPGKILNNDGVIVIDNEKFSFSDIALKNFEINSQRVVKICEDILSTYYAKINRNVKSDSDEKERMLGVVLSKMYKEAVNNDKVAMIHLFGIRYADMIKHEKLNLKAILTYANMPSSYYTELGKGIRLAKYVVEKGH